MWTQAPDKLFFTRGTGRHREKLVAFERALRDAHIARYNIVAVSSIFPPGCKVISREEGLDLLSPGQVLFSVFSRNETDENHRLIASSIGLSRPRDPGTCGYLSEHESFGEDEQTAGRYAEDLAASMLATIQGEDFDSGADYDEQKELWRVSGKIVETTNIAQTAVGQDGLWTVTVAAAVFVHTR